MVDAAGLLTGFVGTIGKAYDDVVRFGGGKEAVAPASNPPPDGVTVPPPGTSPADVAKWWRSLDQPTRDRLIQSRPDVIGALDGIPAADRSTANRSLIGKYQADLAGQRDALLRDIDEVEKAAPYKANDDQTQVLLADKRKQLAVIDGKIAGLEAIEQKTVPHGDNPPADQGYLLGIDPAGDKAIVAIGDPDYATNVATYVPGTFAGLHNLNGNGNGDLAHAEEIWKNAAAGGQPTSVIDWVGYDAPQSIEAAATQAGPADTGAQALQHFQEGLRASHDGPPSHNTVVGYSYGSLVAADAAQTGLDADNLVLVANPGTHVSNVNQLNLTPVAHDQIGKHVFSALSPNDGLVTIAPGIYGGSAAYQNGFGATPLAAGVGGHDNYFDQGNQAVINVGRIVAGQPPQG